jgi:hypothetical protein
MTVAMTYEILAERLGINVASARRLVLRRRWAKSAGNDGKTVVQVPEEFLQNRDDSRTDDRDGNPKDTAEAVAETGLVSDLVSRLAAAQSELVEMARKLGAAETEITTLRAQSEEARATVVAISEKATRADVLQAQLEAERKRADEWKAAAEAPRGWWLFRRRA